MTTAHILLGNDGIPRDKDMLDLYQGFLEYSYKINFYNAVDVISGNLKVKKEDIFCGTINLCRLVWRSLGIQEPKILDYPEQLQWAMHRSIKTSTLGQFRRLLRDNEYNGYNREYFIKPVKTKLFTGNIFNQESQLDRFIGEVGSDTPIYLTTPVKFFSEYRVYVHQHKILDVKHYYGSWRYYPEPYMIDQMVEDINSIMPISYSIDVGIIEDGLTALVECNDGYALGNYGVESKEYATMIRDRWWEIVGYNSE